MKTRRNAVTAYLPQEPCLLFSKETVGEEAPREMLERFGLDGLSDRDPLDLSGGERQKLALTKGTDAAARSAMSRMLRELSAAGTAVLLVTHDAEFAADTADICGMLFNGAMINEAPPAEMFRQNYFYTTPMSRLGRGIIEKE